MTNPIELLRSIVSIYDQQANTIEALKVEARRGYTAWMLVWISKKTNLSTDEIRVILDKEKVLITFNEFCSFDMNGKKFNINPPFECYLMVGGKTVDIVSIEQVVEFLKENQ